ncbi:MAG: GNAT family N-acetyltransferase [Parabacteroides sp.]|nr:GNAT family N-acetyltransferase [Parabacteroides sp.]
MNKQEIINLWRLSFNDSEEFIRLYFDRVYKDENTLAIEKDGQVVSALQMLPYTMTYYGTEISVAYISGACTLPSMRGKGLMKQLMQEAFDKMKYRSVAVAALIPAEPWLFDYYRELGYTEAFDYTEETYVRPEEPVWAPKLTVVPPPEVPSTGLLYKFFDRQLRKRTCCVLHTQDDFITILRDLQLDGGQMLTALDEQEQPVGMAFVLPPDKSLPKEKQQVYIKEFLYDDDRVANLLLQEITLQNDVNKAVYKTPPIVPGTRPMGMTRVIDRERLTHHWVSTHKDAPVSEQLLKEQDIQTFTRIVMGYPYRESYMSLMLD